MTNEQRRNILEFLSSIAMTDPFSYGSSYKFGENVDGRLAVEGDYWLVQSEKYRVNRKTGDCADYDKKVIDKFLMEWLVSSLNEKAVSKALPDDLSCETEVPSYWHKDGWIKEKANMRLGSDDD